MFDDWWPGVKLHVIYIDLLGESRAVVSDLEMVAAVRAHITLAYLHMTFFNTDAFTWLRSKNTIHIWIHYEPEAFVGRLRAIPPGFNTHACTRTWVWQFSLGKYTQHIPFEARQPFCNHGSLFWLLRRQPHVEIEGVGSAKGPVWQIGAVMSIVLGSPLGHGFRI